MIQVSAVPDSLGRLRSPDRPGCRDLEPLLRSQPDGRLVTSLSALAGSGVPPALRGARHAVARLDAADCEASVDVHEIAAETVFELVWTPVTAVVDLMLDWDLPELEISLAELAEWLDVEVAVALRAIERLALHRGVTVRGPAGDDGAVQVRLDLDECPLTAQPCAAPGPA